MDCTKVKEMQDKLVDIVFNEIENNSDSVNTCELGKVIDMIKDISETLYYYDAAEAMEKGGTQVTQITTPAPATI